MMKGTKDPWPLTCGPLGQAQSIRSYLMAHGPGTAHGHMVHGPVKLCLGHGPRTTFTIHPFCYVYIYIYIYIYSACVRLTGDAATGDDVEMDARADADSDYPDWGEDDASWQSHQWDWG